MLLKVIWLDIDNKSRSRYMTCINLILRLDLAAVMLSKNAPADQDKSTRTLDSHDDKDKPKMQHIKSGFLMYKSL